MTNETALSGRRVFLVEDEAIVAMLFQDMLTDLGCEPVAHASHFDDAMEKAATVAFDIAILDVNLNGVPSYPIAAVIEQRGLGVVFASGYAPEGFPESVRKFPLLQKPFQQSDLEQALVAALKWDRST